MKKAIYAGSFDPITFGHLDVITRASNLYETLYVVIMENTTKKYLFTQEERLEMLKKECGHLENVKCCIGSGLTVDFAKEVGAMVMVRGIRAVLDYEYELQSATANMMLDEQIETVFLLSKPHYSFLSSSTVKEIAKFNGNIDAFVSENVKEKLRAKFG